MENVILNNGNECPVIGIGTFTTQRLAIMFAMMISSSTLPAGDLNMKRYKF